MFTIIAAIGRSNELGKDGDLIWHLPSDMKFFRETTSGHTIIMGRKTFDSLGRVLPNRHHVVLTHADDSYFPDEVEVVHSFAEVYTKYRDVDEDVFIIGGGVSKAGQFLVDKVQEYYVKYAWPGIRGIKFALATLGNDAGIYGAASIAIGKN